MPKHPNRLKLPVTHRLSCLCTMMLLVLLTACSDSSDHRDKSENEVVPAALTDLARDISEANGGRAAILHVATGDGRTWDVAAGLADMDSEEPAQVSNRIEIGSISKVFLSVTVLRLVEQGLISLEDPVSQWFDAAQLDTLSGGNGDKLLVRHLLNHSSGIGDYLNFAPDDTVINSYGITGEETYMPEDHVQRTIDLGLNPVDSDFVFPWFTPQDADGQSYPDYDAIPYSGYSNTGYVMLGMIVQAITGQRYEDMIKQEIIEPLGLTNTGFGTDGMQADLTGYAVGLDGAGQQPVIMSPTLSWSAGQTISTTAELAKFLGAAVQGELFDQQVTLDLWLEEYFKPLFKEIPYGLGIMRQSIEEVGTVYGHDGQVFGAVALMAFDVSTGNLYTVGINNSQYISVDNQEPGSIWELVPMMSKIATDNE